MTGLRTGLTTGTCAAAAAKAAAMLLCGQPVPATVDLVLPRGERVSVPILFAQRGESENGIFALAAVSKNAGDDPDATHGLPVVSTLTWLDHGDIEFAAGEGVGMVTKPGLQIPPGQPAINPGPRQMIRQSVRQVTNRPVRVQVSIPGGCAIAAQTFNPRLGIEGGLSILGTTGIVRPYCRNALRAALRCYLDVAAAAGVVAPVLVPGNIGAKAAQTHFILADEQVIHVGNEWGFVLDELGARPFTRLLITGHPGKLAKLAQGEWDTHSSRSTSAAGFVRALGEQVLTQKIAPNETVEGVFESLVPPQREPVAVTLAERIACAVVDRIGERLAPAVLLVSMSGAWLGHDGDLSPWRRTPKF